MNRETSIQQRLIDILKKEKPGQLIFPGDFLSLGTPEGVNMAFSRLAKEKKLVRMGKGIYLNPKIDPVLGQVYPSFEEIAHKIAEKEKVAIRPTGAYALNKLGFSTQVPTKVVFLTNGSPRQIKVGRGTITFKNTTPKKLAAKTEVVFLAIQALMELGEKNSTQEVTDKLYGILRNETPASIKEDARSAPQWITKTLYSIADKIEEEWSSSFN